MPLVQPSGPHDTTFPHVLAREDGWEEVKGSVSERSHTHRTGGGSGGDVGSREGRGTAHGCGRERWRLIGPGWGQVTASSAAEAEQSGQVGGPRPTPCHRHGWCTR